MLKGKNPWLKESYLAAKYVNNQSKSKETEMSNNYLQYLCHLSVYIDIL